MPGFPFNNLLQFILQIPYAILLYVPVILLLILWHLLSCGSQPSRIELHYMRELLQHLIHLLMFFSTVSRSPS